MIARTQALGAAPGDSKSPAAADVCVVIPTYRRTEILKIAIDSILAQEDFDNDPGRSAEDCVTSSVCQAGRKPCPTAGGWAPVRVVHRGCRRRDHSGRENQAGYPLRRAFRGGQTTAYLPSIERRSLASHFCHLPTRNRVSANN